MNNVAYLAHHGVKGQKWGVRRFQNKDGSYTNEGKRRRSGATKNLISSPKSRYADMTDEEISNAIKRRQNELKLADLDMQTSIPLGMRYVGGIVKSGASKGLTLAVGGLTFGLAKKYLKDEYGLDIPNLKK